jgi:hypothetical protein
VFADYIVATKLRMEKDGSIKIYKEAIDKIDAPVPGTLPIDAGN